MAIEKLEDLIHTDLQSVSLEEITLLVAKEKYRELNTQNYLARIEEFAQRARPYIHNVQGGRQAIQAFNHYFFEVEGFCGNRADYYNPSNCYLNDVLDHRSGIPITLSIVYMAIGRRLGLPLSGVNFPGHFLVRYDFKSEAFFVDVFDKGTILTTGDCREKLQRAYGSELIFQEEFLDPASHRQVLLRILANLKIMYILKKDFNQVLPILNRLLLFEPKSSQSLKERGMLYAQLECFRPALNDFVNYLSRDPQAFDRPLIEECIQELREKVNLIQ
ncbi:MAG: transglutaminase family protein [Deltaproteobacteria bacterium]|nr:transglutaminase family protein [Deltaproteobacteria bacterium]MBI2501473.1 transglutaminase family protein [Deltaproteobacteria bacterium]